MDVIDSQIDTRSELFRTNSARLMALVAELRERTAVVRRGGGDRYVQRHREQGKLPVRAHRQAADPNSPFLEPFPCRGGLYDNEAPAAGIVTGIGRVSAAKS
jgi:3-methylcrotonyl-CoA carboxylase beta subunit